MVPASGECRSPAKAQVVFPAEVVSEGLPSEFEKSGRPLKERQFGHGEEDKGGAATKCGAGHRNRGAPAQRRSRA